MNKPLDMVPYRDTWAPDHPHANFKKEVATYSVTDPQPMLENLGKMTDIPPGCLARYILVKYGVAASDALLSMDPVFFRQLQEKIDAAEKQNTDQARLEAYESLKQMISWLNTARKSNRMEF